MARGGRFLLGALLGAAAAALLTPVTGKRARTKLSSYAKRVGVPVDDLGREVRQAARKAVQGASERIGIEHSQSKTKRKR